MYDMSKTQYVSLSQLAKQWCDSQPTSLFITNWLRNRETLEYLKEWELECDPLFPIDQFNKLIETKEYTKLTPKKWMDLGAKSIRSKSGPQGGIYAHPLVALDFCMRSSSTFKAAAPKLIHIKASCMKTDFTEVTGNG